ncbi:hypothetical protein [Effusibacillus consociatus]|uniref:Uncharacterized protein n=1 Tax=Effusibacillus consociatus TaxID=1117041 RepID=A0ABV9PZR6_9BACL
MKMVIVERDSSVSVTERRVTEKRKMLEFLPNGSFQEKEVDWVCFTGAGDEEMVLNGFIPAGFSYSGARVTSQDAQISIYQCVNSLRNSLDCQFVIAQSAGTSSYVLLKDVPTLIRFFYNLENQS